MEAKPDFEQLLVAWRLSGGMPRASSSGFMARIGCVARRCGTGHDPQM